MSDAPDAAAPPDAAPELNRKARFAQALADGMTAGDALDAAGYRCTTENSRRALISRLLKDSEVQRMASSEPEGEREFAKYVWAMLQTPGQWHGKAQLIMVYARLRGFLAKKLTADPPGLGLDDEIPDLKE